MAKNGSSFVILYVMPVCHDARHDHSSRKRVKQSKKRKKSRFFGFSKKTLKKRNSNNMYLDIDRPRFLGLETTLNHICCRLHNY